MSDADPLAGADDLAHTVAHLDPTWAPRCPTCGAKAETLEAAAAVTQVRGTTHLADQLREAADTIRRQ